MKPRRAEAMDHILLLGPPGLGKTSLAGIIANLQIFFRPTSLFNTLVMLGMLAAGLGLVARSLRAH